MSTFVQVGASGRLINPARQLRDHLRDLGAATPWCGRDLDFAKATFDGGDFTGAKFVAGEISFVGAEFAN
jgi:hypothetical protein